MTEHARIKRLLITIAFLALPVGGCAPSYWVERSDLGRATPTVPATRGDTLVQVDRASLPTGPPDSRGGRVLVKAATNYHLRVARALFLVGGVFLTGAAIAGATVGGGDKEVFPQMYSMVALGSAASIFLGVGTAYAIGGRFEAER